LKFQIAYYGMRIHIDSIGIAYSFTELSQAASSLQRTGLPFSSNSASVSRGSLSSGGATTVAAAPVATVTASGSTGPLTGVGLPRPLTLSAETLPLVLPCLLRVLPVSEGGGPLAVSAVPGLISDTRCTDGDGTSSGAVRASNDLSARLAC
jgi:hypothetical protein